MNDYMQETFGLGYRNPGSSSSFTVNVLSILPSCASAPSSANGAGDCSFVWSTNFNWAHCRYQSFCQAFEVVEAVVTNSSNVVETDTPFTAPQLWLVMEESGHPKGEVVLSRD